MKTRIIGAIILAATLTASAHGEMRPRHYVADGNSAVATDGKARFNRALYGAHSGFRMECSDMPEFGIYLPRMGGNLRLTLPEGTCTARYTPGRMDYEQGGVKVEAQVMRSRDMALWAITNTSGKTVNIPVRFGGVADKKFYREGDLGVDDPTCFDLKPEYCIGNVYSIDGDKIHVEYGKKERSTLTLVVPASDKKINESLPAFEGTITLDPGKTAYLGLFPSVDAPAESLEVLMAEAEKQRAELASTVSISTPDPWLNPIGGALAVAADGIWSGQAWLHGSIGWRTPHLGWRGAYAGSSLGHHDRALTHFRTYASNQITDIPAKFEHPRQDTSLNLARAEKKWGTPMYSDGYICRRPGKKDEMSHYDMNLVYIDAMLRHFRHTGDIEAMRELFPVIKRHLDWEKRNFDPDGDHLYDAYCCIWASDALYYSGGAVTHSSAYNLFANRLTAQIAEAIGEDPTPYINEANGIAKAIEETLWLPEAGYWAEYKDAGGHKRLHPSSALWTIYHAIDSEIADPFKNYAATVYVDNNIPRIPVEGDGADGGLYTLSTTAWKPYSWSINNVAIAEVMHTALAYWQAGRNEEAYRLMKATAMDNMYLGASPLNFGQISHYDAARGECYRDFADPIGVWSRALTEGLYGIRPMRIGNEPRVDIVPGFPAEWNNASISLPDIAYSFERKGDTDTYVIDNRYPEGTVVRLTVPALGLSGLEINGEKVKATNVAQAIGEPRVSVDVIGHGQNTVTINRKNKVAFSPTGKTHTEGNVAFREMKSGPLTWWEPKVTPRSIKNENPAHGSDFANINPAKLDKVDLSNHYNARVSDIFHQSYTSPAPATTTLRIPKQGIGEWCHPKDTAHIDNAGLRALVASNGGVYDSPLGVPFNMAAEGNDIVFTSLWDNYPNHATIPLKGKADRLYLAMGGTTNHMQWGMENGIITLRYADGSETKTSLMPAENWAPIEQDYFIDDYAFAQPDGMELPYRFLLSDGRVARQVSDILPIKGVDGRRIDCGAGVLLDILADSKHELESISIETISNDVIIGLMGLTIQRP